MGAHTNLAGSALTDCLLFTMPSAANAESAKLVAQYCDAVPADGSVVDCLVSVAEMVWAFARWSEPSLAIVW